MNLQDIQNMQNTSNNKETRYFIGIMSGTSLDGIDAVLVSYKNSDELSHCFEEMVSIDFPENLKNTLLELQIPSVNEWEKAMLSSNELAKLYAKSVKELLIKSGKTKEDIIAIGVHGQTIRHQPHLGYTSQLNNPSLLAELTDIDVIADFRSRDIAAGGQGAPLVPVYHELLTRKMKLNNEVITHVAFVNIGGMSNVSFIDLENDSVAGHDCGPGNVLIDGLCQKYLGIPYDKDGIFAANGVIHNEFLGYLMQHCLFLSMTGPKSTGRETFNLHWLEMMIDDFFTAKKIETTKPKIDDLIATVTMFTAVIIAQDVAKYQHKSNLQQLIICGGGAHNPILCDYIYQQLVVFNLFIDVIPCQKIGIPAQAIEGAAFAHLAYLFTERKTANKPRVTGAIGERILGAFYPF